MKKVGELITKEAHFVIYYKEGEIVNPYKLYKKWYENGWHRRKLTEYGNLHSCVLFIEGFIHRHYQ